MRRSKWLKRTGRMGALLLLVGSTVFAEPATQATDAEEVPGLGDELSAATKLSAAEQLTQSNDYAGKMSGIQAQVSKLAEKARADKDIIKLNCVNDKLNQIKGHITLAEQIREAHRTAATSQDNDGRNHQFTKLTIIYQKVVILGQEAEACIGEDIAFVGDTQRELEVEGEEPQDDPTQVPPPGLPMFRPPIASPYT